MNYYVWLRLIKTDIDHDRPSILKACFHGLFVQHTHSVMAAVVSTDWEE